MNTFLQLMEICWLQGVFCLEGCGFDTWRDPYANFESV
jgi:hypothetical protein